MIVGGGDDLVFGDDRELPDGWGDDDRIDAGPGNDIVWGDAEIARWGGDEVIVGGEGDDVLYGDGWHVRVGGRDTLIGGEGNDRLYGDSPDSREYYVVYFYPFAPPYVRPGGGPDKLNGGPGDDLLVGGTDNDWLKGDPVPMFSPSRLSAQGTATFSGPGSTASTISAGAKIASTLQGGASTRAVSTRTGTAALISSTRASRGETVRS